MKTTDPRIEDNDIRKKAERAKPKYMYIRPSRQPDGQTVL